MKLTIIIPVFNAAKYLPECLNSILISNKNIEVILVDDGSTDESLKICYKYSEEDKRISVIHQDNQGVSVARNNGICAAKGDYLMFVDADDVLSKDWDNIFNYIGKKDIYYFSSVCGDINKSKLLEYICGTDRKVCLAGPISKAYKRNIIEKNRLLFNEKLINGEDMLFNIEVLLKASNFEMVQFHYYYYRQTLGQTTKRFDDRIIASDIIFHKSLKEIIKSNQIEKKVAKKIEQICLERAILMLINRISYADKYDKVINKYDLLLEEPYGGVRKPFFLTILLKCKSKRFLFYGVKLKNIVKQKISRKKNGEFIEV